LFLVKAYYILCSFLFFKWSSFEVVVHTPVTGQTSLPGTITLVPPSGAITGSNFLLSSEDWIITGNKRLVDNPSYERYSRGPLLNYYILGTDDVINVQSSSSPDLSLWYFEAPSAKFSGNLGIAYGGSISFTLGSFSGDFSSLNPTTTNVVILECADCIGPVGKGITLGYNMAALAKSPNGLFNGNSKTINIPLHESGGWLKDPQNSLKAWYKPSQCDMIQVLSRLSKIRILGDWTTWYETVALDNVQILNTKGEIRLISNAYLTLFFSFRFLGQLPLCSMLRPDASICEC
jgi:hypothetical protein